MFRRTDTSLYLTQLSPILSLFGSYQHSPALSQWLTLHDLVQLLLNWPTLIQWSSVKKRWETWKPPVDVPRLPPAWPHIPLAVIKSRNLINGDNGRRWGENKLSQLCHLEGNETMSEMQETSRWPPIWMIAKMWEMILTALSKFVGAWTFRFTLSPIAFITHYEF